MILENMSLYQKAKITAQYEVRTTVDDGSGNWEDTYPTSIDIEGVYYNRSLASAQFTNMFNTQIDGAFVTTDPLVLTNDYRLGVDGNYYTRVTTDNVALLGEAYVIGLLRLEK